MPSGFWWASWAWSALRRCYDALGVADRWEVLTVSGSVCLTFGRICSAGLIVSAWFRFGSFLYRMVSSMVPVVGSGSAWFRSGLLYVFRLGLPCWIPSRCAACGFPGGILSRSPADCRMMLSRCAADSRRQLSRLAAFVCCVRSAWRLSDGVAIRPTVYRITHPAVCIMRMRYAAHPADGGDRWSDGKRKISPKNLSKHGTLPQKKNLVKKRCRSETFDFSDRRFLNIRFPK